MYVDFTNYYAYYTWCGRIEELADKQCQNIHFGQYNDLKFNYFPQFNGVLNYFVLHYVMFFDIIHNLV